jgi:hypothetical protein
MSLVPFFGASYKDFAPTELGIGIPLNQSQIGSTYFNPAQAGLRLKTRAIPPTDPRRFRVIFVRYGSNLAYVTVFYSDLFYGFGYRLRSYGYGHRSGVRRSEN